MPLSGGTTPGPRRPQAPWDRAGLDDAFSMVCSRFADLDETQRAGLRALFAVHESQIARPAKPFGGASPRTARLATLARRFIRQRHAGAHVSLSSVARTAGVSPSHLARAIKRATGETFSALLHRERIATAMRRLSVDAGATIKEMAVGVGYNSTGEFDRQFKRMTGVTPTEFRALQAASTLPPAPFDSLRARPSTPSGHALRLAQGKPSHADTTQASGEGHTFTVPG